MPLIFELLDGKTGAWLEVKQLIPGDPSAGLSNRTVIGGREMIFLTCAEDDSQTKIAKAPRGFDIPLSAALRRTVTDSRMTLVKELKHGEEYEMMLHTDRMVAPAKARFRHITIDFGTRHCPLCQKDIPGQRFGTHVQKEHGVMAVREWPGGKVGFNAELRRSVETAIVRATGFPRVQERLRRSLKGLNELDQLQKADWN